MSAAPLIGYAAALLGMICWLPQVARTLRTRAVRDLSLATNLMLLGAVVLWLTYGVMVRDWPLIVANIVSTLCVGILVAAKLLWGERA